jgi:hypothetical protein
MDGQRFEQQLIAAVEQLEAEPDPPHTLERLVALTPEFFPTADFVGVSLTSGQRIETPVASNERLRQLDELQYTMREGPCRDAIRAEEVVKADDLATDPRWPRWGARMVAELGIRSSLSFRLFTTDGGTSGALNLYSLKPFAFTQDDIVHGRTIATMSAVVLARSINEHRLATALETRTVIGQATGMLMERFGLDADASFNVLRRLSSHRNEKLRDVARQLVTTRALPDSTALVAAKDAERERHEV